MLVISRKVDESIVIDDRITVMVVRIQGDKVKLGITAARDVPVHRKEVADAIREQRTDASRQQQVEDLLQRMREAGL